MKKRWICILVAVLLVFTMATPTVTAAAATDPFAMTLSDELINVLKTMEGFRAKPYWDYSQWTVGYGTKCPDDKLEEYKANGIPEAEAQALLEKELAYFVSIVNNFAKKHGLYLKQHQFDALVSFTYNCGEAWTYDTKGYFNTAVREQGTAEELIYGMCLYSTAGGEYILIQRRLCEADMYLNGVYRAYNAPQGGVSSYMKYVFLDGNSGETRYSVYGYDSRLESPIKVAFTSIPTGTDQEGNPFAYTLAGWYTADGVKVNTLNGSLKNGQRLYAKWADPEGNIVDVPQGDTTELEVTVTGDYVNIRSGPSTSYDKVGTYTEGTVVTLLETYESGSYTWGRTELGWFRLDYSTYEEVKESLDQFPKHGVVTGDYVNIRSGPGTDYERKGQLNKGHKIKILETATGSGLSWGRMEDGNWICLDYVEYVEAVRSVTTVTLIKAPDKLEYVQGAQSLQLEGSVVLVCYDDGSSTSMSLTRAMITKFDNKQLGKTTVTAQCEGKTVTFTVTLVKATVTFLDYDGTVLATGQYAYGETVVPPPEPVRDEDDTYLYWFVDWSRPVTTCAGNTVYTANYRAVRIPEAITSDIYSVGEQYIRQIPAGTTVDTLIQGINEKEFITAYNGEEQVSGDTLLTTGMQVWLVYEGQILMKRTVIIAGDVDCDGEISAVDASRILQYVAGWDVTVNAAAADVDGNGEVNAVDAARILQYLAGWDVVLVDK